MYRSELRAFVAGPGLRVAREEQLRRTKWMVNSTLSAINWVASEDSSRRGRLAARKEKGEHNLTGTQAE